MAATSSIPWPTGGTGTELHLLFENAPVGIAQCDREGTILAMNPALNALIGSNLCEIQCESPQSQSSQRPRFSDVISMANRDFNVGIFRQLMSGERASFQVVSLLSRSNGADVWLRWTAWGVCGSAHNPDCVLLLAEDITQARRQEEEAGRGEGLQALGRMAGSIAHDFNNLLTGILLYCDLMLTSLGGLGLGAELASSDGALAHRALSRPAVVEGAAEAGWQERDRMRTYAEEIRSASIQASGVVQQLLTVTRPRNPSPHPISLNEIADEMRNLLLRLAGENIELSFHFDPSLGLIRMDRAQAQQMLLNLVLNARDAMPAGGRIQVETGNCNVRIFRSGGGSDSDASHDRSNDDRSNDDRSNADRSNADRSNKDRWAAIPCVLFVVSDNGSGMNEETRRRMFQPYFTTKEEGRGGGLGLASVHDIVAGVGGLVQVESAPNQGTRVLVLLPSEASSRSQEPEPRVATGLRSGG
jgi:two-component system, cell cycle sensor histidine kinase and response regulator CckA